MASTFYKDGLHCLQLSLHYPEISGVELQYILGLLVPYQTSVDNGYRARNLRLGHHRGRFEDFLNRTVQVIDKLAGIHGISVLKTYKEINRNASIIVLEKAESLGGVWAKERLYPSTSIAL